MKYSATVFLAVLHFSCAFGYAPDPSFSDPKWNPMGPGLNDLVSAILSDGESMYVGGRFTNAGGNDDADYIARWDGCTWHAVGEGLPATIFGEVSTIASDGQGGIYVGGYLSDQTFSNFIYHWDGTSWSAFGNALNGFVGAMVIRDQDVYIGGNFTGGIAYWNGSTWEQLGLGLTHQYNGAISVESIYCMGLQGDDLIVGGRFDDLGDNPEADKIARWDGMAWHSMGASWTFGHVSDIVVDSSAIYICGILWEDFQMYPDQYHVARWDGQTWHGLHTNPYRWAYSLCLMDHYLYSSSAYYYDTLDISRLDLNTNTWELVALVSDLGNRGIGAWHLATDGSSLYAGGYFDQVNDQCINRIARFGEPAVDIVFHDIPDTICDTDPPLMLPVDQDGYAGTWSGPGVSGNTIDPAELTGQICLTFTTAVDPEDSLQCSHTIIKVISIACAITDTREIYAPVDFILFPNPCHDVVKVEWPTVSLDDCEVRVTDLMGKVIFTSTTAIAEIQTSSWPAGLYFVEIADQHEGNAVRLMKF